MEVLSGGGMDTDSHLYFRKNYAKYEFFKKPLVSFERRFLQDTITFLDGKKNKFKMLKSDVAFKLIGIFPRSHGFYIH